MRDIQGKPKVVSIRDFSSADNSGISPITQERLQRGYQLLEEQRGILEALQKFKMEMESELSAGAGIEAGALTFDRDLKIVRRCHAGPARILQGFAR